MLNERWASAMTLDEFIDRAEVNQEMWRSMRKHARVPAEVVEQLRAIAGPWDLLVLLEDWCGDAVNSNPVLARLTEEVRLWNRGRRGGSLLS